MVLLHKLKPGCYVKMKPGLIIKLNLDDFEGNQTGDHTLRVNMSYKNNCKHL